MCDLALFCELINLIKDKDELFAKNITNPHVFETFKACLLSCLNNVPKQPQQAEALLLKIETVLDYLHDDLNTGHWSEVPLKTRQSFFTASFVKAVLLIKYSLHLDIEILKDSLKCIDRGLLLGAPLEVNNELLTEAAKLLQTKINEVIVKGDTVTSSLSAGSNPKKRKLSECSCSDLENLPGQNIDSLDIPSIETFNNSYFIPQIPVVLKNCISHWPALTKWQDINYLLGLAAERTVPIEIGSRYTDQDWSQKLMTLREYISKFYLSSDGGVGYLAQHNLFDQITELREDIRVPEYCCCSLNYDESCDVDINAWFGPEGTLSPLHQDPKNNILVQVFGSKRLLLFSPRDTELLYPHEEQMLSNTAQVDPVNVDLSKFPKFKDAVMFKCILKPGEMLFIPEKWWHHVTALDKSFSVSFWWK